MLRVNHFVKKFNYSSTLSSQLHTALGWTPYEYNVLIISIGISIAYVQRLHIQMLFEQVCREGLHTHAFYIYKKQIKTRPAYTQKSYCM